MVKMGVEAVVKMNSYISSDDEGANDILLSYPESDYNGINDKGSPTAMMVLLTTGTLTY